MQKNDAAALSLRSADSNDEAFLHQLYASTRAEEIAAWGWDAAQQEAFLSLQFRAQQAHYDEYPNVDHRIILSDGHRVGRLLVSRLEDEIRLVDMALLPEARGRGIGAALLRNLLAEAALAGKPVRLHVEKSNPAGRLYQRLGFVTIGDQGTHYFMEWQSNRNQPENPHHA
jgi:ribosomal protein S18 acetylase RimI-like enzyme